MVYCNAKETRDFLQSGYVSLCSWLMCHPWSPIEKFLWCPFLDCIVEYDFSMHVRRSWVLSYRIHALNLLMYTVALLDRKLHSSASAFSFTVLVYSSCSDTIYGSSLLVCPSSLHGWALPLISNGPPSSSRIESIIEVATGRVRETVMSMRVSIDQH